VRPIEIVGGLTKLIGGVVKERCFRTESTKGLCKQFLGVSDGCTVLVNLVRNRMARRGDNWIAVQLDVSNAFNELDRDAMVGAVQRCDPGLVGGVKAV